MKTLPKPLEGLRVLDLTRYLAGPYCTMLLGGLGAEVIKVESPGTGDMYRDRAPYAGPTGVSSNRQSAADVGLGLAHRSRNKKSITLNLRDADGQALFRRLAANADVIVENYAPGILAAMGCDYEVLKAANEKIILCSISGFGQDGPLRDFRAYDPIAQAMSGMMSITGFADQPPVRCGAAIADTVAPLVAVIGILSAVLRRGVTGFGDWVDVAMLDVLAFLQPELIEYFQAGMIEFPMGNRHPGGVPFNTFKASDGYVCIATVTDRDWRSVLKAIEREDLLAEAKFSQLAERRKNVDEVEQLVGNWVAERSRDDVVAVFQLHEIACGPVLEMAEMLKSAQLESRGMLRGLELPSGEKIPGAIGFGLPIRFADGPLQFDQTAPALGQHNEEIYAAMADLSKAQLSALVGRGIV